jgi:hypothetical protein
MKCQCPYKLKKYICRYGDICQKAEDEGKQQFNECSVAIRHREGRPWRNEKEAQP